jgi:GR25 family glycosyltransferase involved in LPS biosynthesis
MHTYCINLERRPDRRRDVEKEFHREELDLVEFFTATDGCSHTKMNKGECGCTDSHIRVWRDIVKQGYPYALVFEDDARLVSHFREKLDQIISKLPDDWDYVNLGSIPGFRLFEKRISNKIIKGSSTTAHCYLISQKGAKHISQWNTADVPFIIDMQLARTPLNSFYTQDSLATQNIAGWPIAGFIFSVLDGNLGVFRKSFDFDFGIRTLWPIFIFLIYICIRIQKSGLQF